MANWITHTRIVRKCNGRWERLKHEKTGIFQEDKYYWNIAPNSNNYSEKAKIIKTIPGYWGKVREQYKKLKNMYLTRNDNDHPSFICYIEAINNIYNHLKQKKLVK